MDYFENLLLYMKHKDISIDYKMLKYLIWYSCNKDSYIQRTDVFDKSIFLSRDLDVYVSLLLIKLFDLQQLLFFDKMDDTNNYVKSMSVDKINKNIMVIHRGKCEPSSTLFFNFFAKIRNSIAHGQFNTFNNKMYFLGQSSAKKSAPINFLLQTNNSFYNNIYELLQIVSDYLDNDLMFKKKCLSYFFDLEDVKSGDNYIECFSKSNNISIVIYDSFDLEDNTHPIEVKNLIEQYSCGKKVVVIVNFSLSKFKDCNLISKDGLVQIIDFNMLLEYFNISEVLFEKIN